MEIYDGDGLLIPQHVVDQLPAGWTTVEGEDGKARLSIGGQIPNYQGGKLGIKSGEEFTPNPEWGGAPTTATVGGQTYNLAGQPQEVGGVGFDGETSGLFSAPLGPNYMLQGTGAFTPENGSYTAPADASVVYAPSGTGGKAGMMESFMASDLKDFIGTVGMAVGAGGLINGVATNGLSSTLSSMGDKFMNLPSTIGNAFSSGVEGLSNLPSTVGNLFSGADTGASLPWGMDDVLTTGGGTLEGGGGMVDMTGFMNGDPFGAATPYTDMLNNPMPSGGDFMTMPQDLSTLAPDLFSGGALPRAGQTLNLANSLPGNFVQALGTGAALSPVQQLLKTLTGGGEATPGGTGTSMGGGGGGGSWLPALLGAILGGTSGQPAPITTSATNTSNPWAPAAPYLENNMEFMSSLPNNLSLPTVPGLAPYQTAYTDKYINDAIGAAVAPINDQFRERTLPAIRGGALQAGQPGSSRQSLSEAIAAREVARTTGEVSAGMNQNFANAKAAEAFQGWQAGNANNQWGFNADMAKALQEALYPINKATASGNLYAQAGNLGKTATATSNTQLPATPAWQTALGGAVAANEAASKLFGLEGKA